MSINITTTVLAAAVTGLALTAASPAVALAKAPSTVTIHADGVDLSGTLSSNDPSCVEGDWNTGNTGVEGRFYAKVRATTTCARDLSPTVQAVRND